MNAIASSGLDTLFDYETPEGIPLVLRPAGPVARGMAWAIDMAIRAVAYFIVLMVSVSTLFGGVGTAAVMIFIFLMEWFYPVLFEMYKRATPGKMALGLEVMQADGTPLNWSTALLRNLLRTADFFPLFYGTGLVAMVMNGKFQRLGDLAAGTVVVYTDTEDGRRKIPVYPARRPPRPFTLAEQRLIMDFAERSGSLSAGRRRELAGRLSFLSMDGEAPEQTLLAFANWFSGSR